MATIPKYIHPRLLFSLAATRGQLLTNWPLLSYGVQLVTHWWSIFAVWFTSLFINSKFMCVFKYYYYIRQTTQKAVYEYSFVLVTTSVRSHGCSLIVALLNLKLLCAEVVTKQANRVVNQLLHPLWEQVVGVDINLEICSILCRNYRFHRRTPAPL